MAPSAVAGAFNTFSGIVMMVCWAGYSFLLAVIIFTDRIPSAVLLQGKIIVMLHPIAGSRLQETA